jgi:hypothetical protein
VDEVAGRIPDWAWPNSYTKGKTTPKTDVARKLERIVADHVARSGLLLGKAPAPAVAETARRKATERSSMPRDPEPKDVKLSGAQIDAVVRDQTGGARLGAEGRKFLRTHVVTERKASNRKYLLELRALQGGLSCDACGLDLAKRYGAEHAEVLELHHRVPLRKGAQRPKGTDAFALLCPTCHRVVHYRREDPLDVAVLRAKLLG